MRDGLRRATIAAFATLVVGSAASCTGIDDQLLVVANRGGEQSATIWAVTPGDDLDDGREVMSDTVGPLTIVTRGSDGELRYDELGQAWHDELLLAVSVFDEDPERAQQVLANQPGGDATTIATASQAEAVVVARGVFVFDDKGCRLATRAEKATEVGEGRCSISDNDRWVASWPTEGGDLEVRDLRSDEVVTTKGNFTQAVALTNDARVLAIDTGTTTSVAKVIDATTGKVISAGEAATFLQALPATPDGRGFVLIAERDGLPTLEWVDTDGTTSTIATGSPTRPLLPVNVGDGVDYLALGEQLDDSRLYHWTPGSQAKKVMAGELTATALTPELTLVTRQVDDGLEFWSVHDGERSTRPHVVLRTDTSQHLQVARALTADGVAHVEVTGATGASYVRVDTEGDHSAVVMKHWASLRIGAIDGDGTVVVTGSERADDAEQRLLVVGTDDDEAVQRAAAESFRSPVLVRDGTVYFTRTTAAGDNSVWRVPASARGDEKPERLWGDALLGGAAWAQYGGMSETSTVDPVRLAELSGGGGGAGGGAGGG